MRPHQQQIIRAIYEASAPTNVLSDDFARWMEDVVITRGELDRKKKVGTGDLQLALGGGAEQPSLERFVYSVERYLARRGLQLILACVRGGRDAAWPEFLRVALRTSELIDSAIAPLSDAVATERGEVLDLVNHASGPITDVFQAEFMNLIPRQVRHAIGSFYTPQWLARHVLRSSGYRWESAERLTDTLVDPSCGSGVFLAAAAEEIRQATEAGAIAPDAALAAIHANLRGVDIELVPCVLATANLVLASHRIVLMTGVGEVHVPHSIRHADSLDPVAETERVDLVVGNPPWVNWEYMPREYKEKHAELWPLLGIFDAGAKYMAFSKEDISALFVAHAVHDRLKPSGRFAFILPESLIKSTMNHRGFRRFEVGLFPVPYRILIAEDFVDVKPFEGVANRTIVLYGDVGGATGYPVPYRKWKPMGRVAQPTTGANSLVGEFLDHAAQLSEANNPSSSWSTGPHAGMDAHRKLDGSNAYRARTGLFTGGANAVFHLRPLAPMDRGLIKVENVIERAKRAAPQVSAEIEDQYVYPFLRGRDVTQWKHTIELGVLLPHTPQTRMAPVSTPEMEATAPRTLTYLDQFRVLLDERKGFSKWESQYRDAGYYAVQRVGDYTFADWKVVWRYISPTFTSAVIGPAAFAGMGAKPVIPNEKLMLIACESSDEAFFVGGVLSSSLVIQHVQSRMISTQISPSIIAGVNIPKFDATDRVHLEISRLCALGHDQMAATDSALDETVSALDREVARLWHVDADAALEARASLAPKRARRSLSPR